jgi:hypothetical protein
MFASKEAVYLFCGVRLTWCVLFIEPLDITGVKHMQVLPRAFIPLASIINFSLTGLVVVLNPTLRLCALIPNIRGFRYN